jgi:hypothetical protein
LVEHRIRNAGVVGSNPTGGSRRFIRDFMTHKQWSYIKSVIRLIGYVLIPVSLVTAAVVLFVSEVVGIAEEWNE